MVLSEAAAVPSSSSLACLGWFQESVTSEKSCCGTGSNRARGSHPSILTSSRFMTHNKKQRLPAQHLACCENEDMDTALALILTWSQSITQFPEMAANRDTCWADLFWTSHASLARPPHRPLQGSEAQFQHGVDRESVPPCTHEDGMKTAICCRACHTNSSTTEKAPRQPQRANISVGKMGDSPKPS